MAQIVRPCTLDDAGSLAEIYDPIVACTFISFEETPPGAAEMRRRIAAAADRFPWLAFECDGRVLGYVYASAHRSRPAYRWSVDVSAYVSSEARRLGVARRLYVELFRVLAAQGYRAAFAGIALPNAPSCKLHESVGFRAVGVYHGVGFKLGAWRDVAWYERPLAAGGEPPWEPVALTALGEPRTFEVDPTGNARANQFYGAD